MITLVWWCLLVLVWVGTQCVPGVATCVVAKIYRPVFLLYQRLNILKHHIALVFLDTVLNWNLVRFGTRTPCGAARSRRATV